MNESQQSPFSDTYEVSAVKEAKKLRWIVILFLLIGLAISASANDEISYEVIDLGVLPGGYHSFATGINADGVVCGSGYTETGSQAFKSDGSSGIPDGICGMTEAYGIGDDGTVVGMTIIRQRIWPSVFRNGKTTFLSTLGGGWGYARACQNGIVVGAAGKRISHELAVARPCLWIGTRAIELLFQPGQGWANDINCRNQIVGTFFLDSKGPSAFIWQAGRSIFIGAGYAAAINNSNQIVGWRYENSKSQAIVWRRFKPKALATIDDSSAWANDINNDGVVCGSSGNSAVVWRKNNRTYQIYDLNDYVETDEWLVFAAMAINDKGEIACRGQDRQTGATHALLLKPIEPTE